jgi:replicative DNA helicase
MIANNPQPQNLRIPPHSMEAEQSVLAAIMSYGKVEQTIREALDMLSPDMFYTTFHQGIYRTIAKLGETDAIAVADEMVRLNMIEPGQFADVVSLGTSSFTKAGISRYVSIIRDRHAQRYMIGIASNALEQLYAGESADTAISELQERAGMIDTSAVYDPRYIGDMVNGWMDVMEKRALNDESVIGSPTGIDGIDKDIVGLGANWLVVLGGRPSHGKSLIAQHIANTVSRTGEVLFMSMEMSYGEIIDRVISLMAHCDPTEIRRGTLDDYGFARVSEFLKSVTQGNHKLYYDDTPSLTIDQVCARAKAFKRKHPKCKLIQIDYLGLMQTPKAERNDLSIKTITNRLKQLSKEIETPIMLLTQLSREADKAERNAMTHLADSAAIERDADLVIFCRNLGVHNPEIPKLKGHWMINCGKNRHGQMFNDVYLKSHNNQIIEMELNEIAHLFEVDAKKSNKGGFDL